MKRSGQEARKTLLETLRRREDAAQLAVAGIRGQAERALARIERLKGELAKQNHQARRALFEGGPAAAMGSYRKCAADLIEAVDREKSRLARLHEELHYRCTVLVEARKQRRVLETVVNRAVGRRQATARIKEARQTDETHRAHGAWRMDRASDGAAVGDGPGSVAGPDSEA